MAVSTNSLAKTERNQEIIDRVIAGRGSVSLTEMAAEYGLTRSRIQAIVGDAGISMRAMKRAQRRPVRVECRQCDSSYPKGGYVEHCQMAGHRRLTPPGEKVERNQLVVEYYEPGGYNTSEIAEAFAIPQPVVTRILHRAGIRAEGRRKRKGGLVAGSLAS